MWNCVVGFSFIFFKTQYLFCVLLQKFIFFSGTLVKSPWKRITVFLKTGYYSKHASALKQCLTWFQKSLLWNLWFTMWYSKILKISIFLTWIFFSTWFSSTPKLKYLSWSRDYGYASTPDSSCCCDDVLLMLEG